MPRSSAETDDRCSEACTRAGLAALLITGAGLALVSPIERLAHLQSAATYAGLRAKLKNDVDEFLATPHWSSFEKNKTEKTDPRFWHLNKVFEQCASLDNASIRQRLDQMASGEAATNFIDGAPSPPVADQDSQVPASDSDESLPRPTGVPAAPTGLTIGVTPSSEYLSKSDVESLLRSAVETLQALHDDVLLAGAKKYSQQLSASIDRWELLRDRIAKYRRNESGELSLASEPKSAEAITWLTIFDLQQLNDYESLPISFVDEAIRANRISVPGVAVDIEAGEGDIFVGFALLVTLLYFWLYAKQARTGNFAAPGTLFGAVNQDQVTKYVFVLLAACPFASLCRLFIAGDRFPVGLGLVALLVLSVSIDLVRVTVQRTSHLKVSVREAPAVQAIPENHAATSTTEGRDLSLTVSGDAPDPTKRA